MSAYKCIVIGAGTFATSCINILLKNNYTVTAIVSSCQFVSRLATSKGIKLFRSFEEPGFFEQQKTDFIFNISSQLYLDQKLLSIPRYFAVNFHPSPLPKYAGIRSAAWAILNDEKQFGCTWHVMNEILDGGDILKLNLFDISNDDTALSLTMKCYQHGMSGFEEMLNEFNLNKFNKYPQNLMQRTYYSSKDNLSGRDYINWSQAAAEIYKISRACYMGMQPDKHFKLKMTFRGKDYVVKSLKSLDKPSNLPPGKIVALSNEELIISTKTNNISIKELLNEEHELISIKAFIEEFDLKQGMSVE